MRQTTAEMFLSSLTFCLCLASSDSFAFHRSAQKASARHVSFTSPETAQSPAVNDGPLRKNDFGKTILLASEEEFIKPDRDRYNYRMILLPNNLQVLLVSNGMKEGDVGVEAASVHVQAGHFDDSLSGLAHFHEHMLFLGTKRYPDEDEYERFLNTHSGFSNAYTDMEDTNYYFSLTTEAGSPDEPSEALTGALDRFAQFFIAPLFSPDAVERELKAIDSEYSMSKTSDSWRNFQLIKSACNSDHRFSKFGCGNYETLSERGSDILLSELKRFWDTYYQSYNLRLAVVGHASLDALQKTVEDTFGNLPQSEGFHRYAKSLPGQIFSREHVSGVAAFGPDQLGLVRKVIPYAETRVIKLYFATPPLDDPAVKKARPDRVLAHILGHESPGSLYHLLNGEGFIQSLSAGSAIDTSDFSLFAITVSLTPKGMKEREKVLDYLFQWIALFKGSQEKLPYYHNELRQISEVNFKFRENGDPTDFASSAAELLFDDHLEPKMLIKGSSAVSDYDPDIAKAFFDRISPTNCMITVTSSDFDGSQGEWETEKWYGAKYQTERIAEASIAVWTNPSIDERLHLPALNKYIPTDFSLKCDSAKDKDEVYPAETESIPPELIINKPYLRLWHKMDRFWRIPKTYVRFALNSPHIYSSPRSMTLNRLFQRVLNDDLNSFVYDASLAGCGYRVSCAPRGYRISVSGYSEKVPFLLETLTSRIISLIEEMKTGNSVLERRFMKAKESLLRETKNYRLDTPHEVNNYNSRLLIEESVWYLDDYLNELEGEWGTRDPLTMEECAKSAEQCFTGRLRCEALCMGNIDENGARAVAKVVEDRFLNRVRPMSEAENPVFRSFKLPTRDEAVKIFGPGVSERQFPLIHQNLAFSATEENHAVEIILQVGSEFDLGYEGMAMLDLMTHMSYLSAFNQLRTKEQLGYYVSSFARKTAGGSWSMVVLVQSAAYLPEKLEESCEAWLVQFRKELEEMDPKDIVQEASSVAAQLLEVETKLSQEVSRVWGEILNTEGLADASRTPAFDRLEKLADILTVDEDEGESNMTGEELKRRLLDLYDRSISASSPNRRALSARVYGHKAKAEYEASLKQPGVLSSYSDMIHLKQHLSTWPIIPYWTRNEVSSD
jgi:insulysin